MVQVTEKDRNFRLFPHIARQRKLIANHPINPQCGHKGKVFGIGFYKSGTTSLSQALSSLGYKRVVWSTHKPIRMKLLSHTYSPLGDWYRRLHFPLHVGSDDISWLFHHPHFLSAVKHVSARASIFGDGPWLHLYRIFNEWFPESKFVLTVRDSTYDFINSSLKQIARINLKKPKIEFQDLISKKAYGVSMEEHIMLSARAYEKHNDNVFRYFNSLPEAKGKLLTLRIGKQQNESWDKLCSFVGCVVPGMAFPKLNIAPQHQEPEILPRDYSLNWKTYRFSKKYQELFNLIESYEDGKTDLEPYWKN